MLFWYLTLTVPSIAREKARCAIGTNDAFKCVALAPWDEKVIHGADLVESLAKTCLGNVFDGSLSFEGDGAGVWHEIERISVRHENAA